MIIINTHICDCHCQGEKKTTENVKAYLVKFFFLNLKLGNQKKTVFFISNSISLSLNMKNTHTQTNKQSIRSIDIEMVSMTFKLFRSSYTHTHTKRKKSFFIIKSNKDFFPHFVLMLSMLLLLLL